MPERRQHFRGRSRSGRQVAVEVRRDGRPPIVAQTRDIGVGGAFILTADRLLPGFRVELALDISASPLVLRAEVRWTQPGIGMGVRFETLGVDDLLALGELLASVATE